MKVLMLIDDLGVGGAQTHVAVLARGLCRLGCEVFLASSGGASEHLLKGTGVSVLRLPNVAKRGVGVLNLLWAKRAVRTYIKAISPDVVHSHTRRMAFIADGVCRSLKIPHVFTAHAKFSMEFPKNFFSCYGDGVIAVSEDIKEHILQKSGVGNRPFCVIENGVELPPVCATKWEGMGNPPTCDHLFTQIMEKSPTIGGILPDFMGFSPTLSKKEVCNVQDGTLLGEKVTRTARCTVETAATHRTVVFVSRLDGDCSLGARLLCEIAPRLDKKYVGIEIIIVGGGEKFGEIGKMARKMNEKINRKLINAVGRVDDPSVFFGGATVFVGVSRAALEAMASFVPVILLGDEGYLGVLDRSVLGEARRTNLTCRGARRADADVFFADICRILDMSEEERRALGSFGRSVAEAFYSSESMASRTAEFYKEVGERGDKCKMQSAKCKIGI